MFSRGTYNRYLFEIDSTHHKMRETYNQLARRIEDPAIRKALDEFVHQIEAEQKTLEAIRAAMLAAFG